MFEPRMLGRQEGLLRDPATGSSNLAAAAGVWHELAPAFADEVLDVGSLGLVLAGRDLLAHLDGFGGAPARLEIAVDVEDGYGRARDLASLAPHRIESGADWREGSFTRTVLDPHAGRLADGSERAALRGGDLYPPGAPPGSGSWVSAPIELRYGRELVACSWELWPVRDASGAIVAPPAIAVRGGSRSGGTITWQSPLTVAQSPAEIAAGHAELATPLAAELIEWTVKLPFLDPGAAGRGDQPVLRTAAVFSLAAWIRLERPRWRFDSLAELLDRAELARHVAPRSFAGTDDGVVLRIPLAVLLRGRLGERIRARLVGAGAARVTRLELAVVADIAFERPGG